LDQVIETLKLMITFAST